MEVMHDFFPGCIVQIAFAENDMQIAVTDMRIDFYRNREGILAADMHNFFNGRRNAVYRHNNIVGQGNLAYKADRFLAVAAHCPDTVIRFQNFNSTCCFTQLVKLLHLHVQLILTECFYRNDNVNTVLIMRCALKFNIIGAGTHIGIIHIFHARRVQTGLHNLRHYIKSLERVVKNCQQVKAIRRHRLQLQSHLGDNTQSTFAAHYQLLHAIACAAFFQTAANLHDFAGRGNHLQAVNLITGNAIADSLAAAGVGCQIAADQAAFGAAGVTCVKIACFVGHLLNINGTHAGFGDNIHRFGIHLDNFIQALHEQYNTAADSNCAIGKAGTAAADSQRHIVLIAQLHNCGNFFGIGRTHNSLRHTETARIIFLVGFILLQLFRLGKYIGVTYYGAHIR